MDWQEGSFGKALYRENAMIPYARVYDIRYEYIITTEGIVLRGGCFGTGSIKQWADMDGPIVTDDGFSIGGINFKGTVCVHTINAKDFFKMNDDKEHKPEMSEKLFYRFMAARKIALAFKGNPTYQRMALIIWKEKYKCQTEEENRIEDLIKDVQEKMIEEIFTDADKREAAKKMLKQGKLEESDLKKTSWQIQQKVEAYIAENRKARQETKKSKSAEFREANKVEKPIVEKSKIENTLNSNWISDLEMESDEEEFEI